MQAVILVLLLAVLSVAAQSCPRAINPVLPDLTKVKADIETLILTPQPDVWPADVFGGQATYGPFFIRQAWHCAGSYRTSDGYGGCDGGRQRFNPELSWDDNTNLEKAKTLLWPIKEKYGAGLSWGDLIILTGTTAIEMMGGPVLGFCGGRIDDPNGDASKLLGPTHEQEEQYPCPVNGACPYPFGTTTIGLIYVNPEGPMGKPDPMGSAHNVHSTFERMGMNMTETVALIGGGHAFGKTHGACPLGAGPSPKEDPENPWPGMCGPLTTPNNVYTSGFEGPWSATPNKWSNGYFKSLVNYKFEKYKGPGNKWQWGNSSLPGIMMLTSDISLQQDPMFFAIVKDFANNITYLEEQFSAAWYKLVTRDMGPASRCLGPWVPPPQPFQYPLPPPPPLSSFPNFAEVQAALLPIIYPSEQNNGSLAADVLPSGQLYNGAIFVQLAWLSAATYRQTDYLGGANGARIRFPPQATWPQSAGMQSALDLLAPVKQQFGDNLSWADLIVFAAQVALEQTPGLSSLIFCPGRTDATDGAGAEFLSPTLNASASIDDMQQRRNIMGLTNRELVVLSARLRSSSIESTLGCIGGLVPDASLVSNDYFKLLLNQTWTASPTVPDVFVSSAISGVALRTDLNLKWHPDWLAIVEEMASDNKLFLIEFASAWTKLMNIDRFDGPAENICNQPL